MVVQRVPLYSHATVTSAAKKHPIIGFVARKKLKYTPTEVPKGTKIEFNSEKQVTTGTHRKFEYFQVFNRVKTTKKRHL